jgi:NAD(P)-dependent dehydrogenase (short-subunit alcohol dehydrogenase family)
MNIAGSVALIAGGAAGLGRATAEALAARGASVVVLDLPTAADAVPTDTGLHFAAGDVRDPESVQAAVELAAGLGPLRIVVNCAGVGAPARTVRKGEPMSLEHFKTIVDINRDLAQYGVRCVTIAPGIFDTALLGTLSEEVRASLGAAVPHPARLGTPPEYAQLAVQVVENPMLNGEVIRLDGALRMAPR